MAGAGGNDLTMPTHELVLQRILGHKQEIPGLAQWTVHASQARFKEDPETEHNRLQSDCKCWICGKKTFTLIFWSRKIGYHYYNSNSEHQSPGKLMPSTTIGNLLSHEFSQV